MSDPITVKLIPNAADALDQVRISKGYTETDAINRAIQLSALVERKLGEGFLLAFVKKDRRGDVVELEVVNIDDKK